MVYVVSYQFHRHFCITSILTKLNVRYRTLSMAGRYIKDGINYYLRKHTNQVNEKKNCKKYYCLNIISTKYRDNITKCVIEELYIEIQLKKMFLSIV